MVERIDIERALDDLISHEEGMRFQGLAVVLAKLRWRELIACERHNDLGLDAYASPTLAPDKIGKGLACSITATFAKLNGDAKAAKEHYGPASVLIFATPRKVTKEIEKEWAEKIRTAYEYELVVISREEIITLLQFPDHAWICRTHLKIPVPYQPAATDLLEQIRQAAAVVAAAWAAHPRLACKPQIALHTVLMDTRGSDTREVVTTEYLRTLLLQGRRIVLEGPAGCGKTTTLIQLARAGDLFQGIPILVDLPGWVRSGLDMLEYIAQSPAFRGRGIDADALARIVNIEPYLFLLNGWNEISDLHSQAAADALRTLERAFPAAGIIVATRTHHIVPPLPGAARFRLLPLTPEQRFTYLVQALGPEAARTLDSKLSSDRALNDLTRTPFILSEVANIFRLGHEIPTTKLQLLRAVIELIEHAEEHAGPLQAPPLRGRAEVYLRSLAAYLTGRGEVLLTEAAGCAVSLSTSQQLRDAGQIATAPEPTEILSALAAHHILDRVEYPERSFRFEHQQFQEYYSALRLRDLLVEVASSDEQVSRDAFAEKYINEPAWEEPLRIVAQDLGNGPHEIAASTFLVDAALRVDPVFAATLFSLCESATPTAVRNDLSERLRALYAAPNQHYQFCALAAMLASGSDAFVDILIPLLTNPDQQVRRRTYRAGADFHPSSLGPQWREVVASWSEQHRGEFVSELTLHQGRIEIALTFARTDPSLSVRLEALRALVWMGQRSTVAEILQSLPDSEFTQVLQTLDVDDLTSALRARSTASYKALLGETNDAKNSLQIALKLAELGDPDAPAQVKGLLTDLPDALVKELSDYTLRPAADIVRRADPQWLSEWVTDRVIRGVLRRDNWLPSISGLSATLRDGLLQRATSEDLRRSGGSGALAVLEATADPDLAKAIFVALRDHHEELLHDPRNELKQGIDAQLRHLLRAIPPSVVIEGLTEILSQPPRDDELCIVTDMFAAMRTPDGDDLRTVLPDHQRQRLRAYLKSAVAVVLKQRDFRGEIKGLLASALAEAGEPEDIDDLVAMIRADITRVREGRLAMAGGDRSAKTEGSSMCWSGWHVAALVRLSDKRCEAILLEILNDPEYELDAAWGFQEIARREKPRRNGIWAARFGQPARDYRAIRERASTVLAVFNEDARARSAAAIRQRILKVLEESKTGDHKTVAYHHRLKELAKVLAVLDAQHSAELILDIAALPARFDAWLRLALLDALNFGGVSLPSDRVLAIIEPILDQLRAHGIYNDNANLVNRVLCLLPFVTPAAEGLARVHDLLAEFRFHLHGYSDLLMALSQCPDEAGLALLCDLASQSGAGFQHMAREWIQAVAACPLPGAQAVLVGFADPEAEGAIDLELPDYARDTVAEHLADHARADSALLQRFIDLTSQPVSGQRRLILAKAIAWLDSPRALVAGLNLIDDALPQPLPYDLWKAFEDVFLEKRPYKGNPRSYKLVPRAESDIKRRLFEMVKNDPRRAQTADSLLGQIEEWRLEYGRPALEPRHPLYQSGDDWPPYFRKGSPLDLS